MFKKIFLALVIKKCFWVQRERSSYRSMKNVAPKHFVFQLKFKKVSGWTVTVERLNQTKVKKIKIWFCFPFQAINGGCVWSVRRLATAKSNCYREASARNFYKQTRSWPSLVKQIWWVSFLIFTIMKDILNYRERTRWPVIYWRCFKI